MVVSTLYHWEWYDDLFCPLIFGTTPLNFPALSSSDQAPKKEQGKDIRSFFTSISPKTPSAKAPEDDMAKRKKKALAISDSDSDDLMAPTPQVKRSKAKVEDGAKSNKVSLQA